MMRMEHVLAAALAATPGLGAAFDLQLQQPALHLSVPGVAAATLQEPDPAGTTAGGRRLSGRADGVAIEVELLPQAGEASPRVCAGTVLRGLVAQPDMPPRDQVYRAPLDETTFLVLYRLAQGPSVSLHAHVIAAAGARHCANAHFSRPLQAGEDLDRWRTMFTSAHADPP